MKNLVFYGDGLLCPPEGYGEAVVELLVTHRPGAVFKSFHSGEEHLALDKALGNAAVLIGKAPDVALFALGTTDLLQGAEPAATAAKVGTLAQLLAQKTHAQVALANVCTAFLPETYRAAAAEFNAALALQAEERVRVLDLDAAVTAFLDAHRRGGGEKRSLHLGAQRLTSTGRVFLSNTVYRLLRLDEVFAG